MSDKLRDKYFQKGSEFLKVDYPIICGAMTWVSEPKLVAAVCNAGGFGCLAGGNAPVEILKQQIEETKKLTDKPFAVNIITITPAYQDHLKLVTEMKMPYIVFAGGLPKGPEIAQAKASGAKVICFAAAKTIAKRMIKYGADALILEGTEAGGHIGQVSLNVLIQQIMFENPDFPFFVAGGIGTGKFAAHMFMMGATGIQLGTRFAISTECIAHENFKKKFLRANPRDAIATPTFDSRLPVVPVRAIKNKGHEEFNKLQLELIEKLDNGTISKEDAQIKVEGFWMGALRKAVVDGDAEQGSLMAGQSVGMFDSIKPVKEIVEELVDGIEEELQAVKKILS